MRWRTARRAFRSFAYAVVDFFRIPQMNRHNLAQFLPVLDGWENLEYAMKAGRGGILITVHMGSTELGAAYLGLRGVPLTLAALPHKDPRINQLFVTSRESAGLEVVPVGGALPKLQEAVTRGRLIVLASDRDVTGRGPLLPFLGQVTHMPSGPARIALRTGAPIIPACLYRLPNREPRGVICSAIFADPATDTEESLTLRCLAVLEEFIRARPEQWSSFFDLWSETERPVL